MNKKVDPAPAEKPAADPKQAVRDDKKKTLKLEEGLEEIVSPLRTPPA
jgi:hypothetical protein